MSRWKVRAWLTWGLLANAIQMWGQAAYRNAEKRIARITLSTPAALRTQADIRRAYCWEEREKAFRKDRRRALLRDFANRWRKA